MLDLESSAVALESSMQEKSSKASSKSGPKRKKEPDISTLAAKPEQKPAENVEASQLSPPSHRAQSEKLEERQTEQIDDDEHSSIAMSHHTTSKLSTKYSATSHRTASKLSTKQSERSYISNRNESNAEEGMTGAEQLGEVEKSSHSAAELAKKDEDASLEVMEDGEDGEVAAPADALAESTLSFTAPDKGREYNPKAAEETLEDLISTTRSLYPESRIVIALAILGILWVVAIIVLSAVGHTHVLPYRTDTTEYVPAPTTTVTRSSPSHPRTPETVDTSVVIPSTPATSATYSCSTSYCEREGAYIKSLLSTQINPCENFYDYVCDAWRARAGPNIGMELGAAISRDTILEEETENEVIEYLRSENPDVLPAVQLHRACIESTQHEITEVKMALKEMFKEMPGETWPVPRTETSLTPSDVWLLAGKLYREFGIDAFLGITIGTHQNTQPLVVLELPQTFFFKDYETYSMMNNMFRDAITEAAVGLAILDVVQEVTEDVYTAFRDLDQRQPADATFNFKIVTIDDLPPSLLAFLQVVFDGVAPETIVVRSPDYILTQLDHHVKVSDIPSLINYLGFRLIVRMAPFFPSSGFENLKLVFSLETTGRVRTLPLNNNAMCLRAVTAALPVCVVKAHARASTKSGNDLTNRIWLSQIESSFFRNTARLSWVDDLTYSLIRFRLANTKLARFFPSWSLNADQCNGSISNFGSNVAHIYRRLSEQAMRIKLGQVGRPLAPREPGFPFDTRSRYSWGQQTVYVPLGLINTSVPSNATLFAFHLSRTAVRLFRSLTPLLRQEPTALGASYNLEYTSQSHNLLDRLLGCLYSDFASILQKTRVEFILDPYDARYALLAQTVAVSLAFVAFRELLHVERIWKISFRLSSLPELSSDQLFFIWYALDNCEKSDPAYQLRQYETWQRLPPDLAVNFPLRHLPQFGDAFHCQPGSGMQPPLYAPTCNIFNTTTSYGVAP
ncbi:hypothetical protein V5799_002886 [Amblyomma americanum]|uniref:M13 family peptidase n=1 Tax=Amblyomma americanum TaxID=6943 RepID=A0AAQ4DAI7_AMBAM